VWECGVGDWRIAPLHGRAQMGKTGFVWLRWPLKSLLSPFLITTTQAWAMASKVSSLSDGRSDEYLLPHRSPSPSPPSWSTGCRWLSMRGRRLLFATCTCLAAASLFGLLSLMVWSNQSKSQVTLDHENQLSGISKPKIDEWGPLSVLRGPATDSLWGLSKCTASNRLQLNSF